MANCWKVINRLLSRLVNNWLTNWLNHNWSIGPVRHFMDDRIWSHCIGSKMKQVRLREASYPGAPRRYQHSVNNWKWAKTAKPRNTMSAWSCVISYRILKGIPSMSMNVAAATLRRGYLVGIHGKNVLVRSRKAKTLRKQMIGQGSWYKRVQMRRQ